MPNTFEHWSPNTRHHDIPRWRKLAYYGGAVLQVVGLLMFFSVFFMVFRIIQMPSSSSEFFGPASHFFRVFPLAMVGILVIGGGQFLQRVGRNGLVGSGVLLPPTEAVPDESSRSVAAQQNQTLQEAPGPQDADSVAPQPEVRVRCRSCGYLETEDAKYCSGCGAQI